ncbi:MAG: tyrosine--tRNA ligase [bacterium]
MITKTPFPPVKEQMSILLHGAQEVITEDELEQKLTRSYRTGKPLIVKQGFDPSAPDLHIGHAVTIRKLRQFQDLGHQVVFLIGDFTGMVGDPSGRSKTRPRLTREAVVINAETYKNQVYKILNPDRTSVRFNSEWHSTFNIYEFLDLISKHTVARILERDDFLNRYKGGEPISILELLYPILQAYDSVALHADVEMGGMDQKFNLLLGRKTQSDFHQEAQVTFMMPLLRGTDGKEKMSKSLGNYIGIYDPPEEIYGKVMSIPDELIVEYFTLATEVPALEVLAIKNALKKGDCNPMYHKQRLARELVSLYHSVEDAKSAEDDFISRFRHKEIPEGIPDVEISWSEDRIPIVKLLLASGSVASASEGRRLLQGGGVSLNGERIDDFHREIATVNGLILKVGKRRIYRILFAPQDGQST